MKRIRDYFFTGVIIACVLAPVLNSSWLRSFTEFWTTIFFGWIYAFSALYCSVRLFQYLDKKYDWKREIWKRLVVGVVVVELWSMLVYVVVTPPLLVFFKAVPLEDVFASMKNIVAYPLVMGVISMVIISSIEFFNNWKAAYLKQEKMKAEMMAYRYEALHNQLNPHFLFNSFNVLSSLVFESEALAVRFIDQLSDLYRRVLDQKDKDLVTLSEELQFVQSYVFLLKTRFQDKLHIQVDIQPMDDEWIAPMVIQLLIENAVKHNTISREVPLVIYIQRKENYIETRNAIRLKRVGDESKGTGLHNIKQRYGFFTDEPIEVIETREEFLVRIPLLKQNSKSRLV